MNERAQQLIDLLQLTPHPEGGFFKETYRSADTVKSSQTGHLRSAVTDIYFLLTKGQKSRLHRVLHDELWHFFEGAPLRLLDVHAESRESHIIMLGDESDTPVYQYCIRGGNWQAAVSTGEYSLMGCTVAPGFDFNDFKFLSDDTEACDRILDLYPDLINWV